MLPKSLIVAVSSGVASAGLLGLLFLYVGDGRDPVFVDGASVSVVADMERYKTGQPVKIAVINSGTVPLESPGMYGLEIRGLDTMLIYSVPDQAPHALEPGQEVHISWDQTKSDGTPVLQGVYKIHIRASAPDGTVVRDDVSVQVLG